MTADGCYQRLFDNMCHQLKILQQFIDQPFINDSSLLTPVRIHREFIDD